MAALDCLYDRLTDQSHDFFARVVELAQGAAYLQAPHLLQRNVAALSDSLRAAYPNAAVAYSYKTNYARDLVNAARAAGALSEVVSLTELDYAVSLGVADRDIIMNGPGKSDDILRAVLGRDLTVIVDSVAELARADALAGGGLAVRARIGLRFAPRLAFVSGTSRFGIDTASADQVETVRTIARAGRLNVCGAHLHISQDRSADSFEQRLRFLAQTWAMLDIGPPDFLDCGGGLGSAMPEVLRRQLPYGVASLPDYGRRLGETMADLYPDGGTALYCEPGTGLLSDVTVFVTPVMDVKTIGDEGIAVVDGTLFTVNPLRSAARPVAFLSASDAAPRAARACNIYGNSCMDIDLLLRDFETTPRTGDVLVMAQKGAYAGCMAPPFIQGIPALVSLAPDGGLRLARARTTASLLAALN